jgi:hypothetical protein
MCFFIFNVCRYVAGWAPKIDVSSRDSDRYDWKVEVGLYKLNAVDPELESAWLQPMHQKGDILVSKFAFKLNLCRCIKKRRKEKEADERRRAERKKWLAEHKKKKKQSSASGGGSSSPASGGAVQVRESSLTHSSKAPGFNPCSLRVISWFQNSV